MNEPSVRENCPQDSLVGQVADEFLRRQEQGEHPDIEEYANKYPEAADLMRKVLLSLKVLEHSGVGVAAGAAAESEDPPPRELGDFQILREIGRGGMGIVYEAEQISLGRRVALKILPFAATMDKRHLQRFLNEARAAAWLRHPHIVPVYAVGCTRGVNYYAMQLIEGQTLESLYQVLREEPKTPTPANVEATAVLPLAGRNGVPKQPSKGGDTLREPRGQGSTLKSAKDSRKHFRRLAELAIQAADALEHAHQSGVIHRDVKPANLLLDEEGDLWVTDFGLAQVDRDSRLTMTGDLLGTLRYMSPEQALAKRVIVDQRTDIYSLGATFYEMLTLKPVFAGKDRQELLRQIAFEEPAPPRRLDKHIPIELETVILKCLEKNPQDRYGTAKELADDLKRFLNDEPTLARRPSVLQRGRKWGRRHVAGMRATAGALFVIVAIAAVMAGWWLRDHAARQSETERVVSAALDETIEWQRQRKMPEALNAAKRAKAILASGSSTAALQERVHKRLADLTAVAEIEAIRVQQGFEVQKEDWYVGPDYAQTEKKYTEVFLTLGIDVEAQATDTVASLIRERSVAVELAAALDELSCVEVGARPPLETMRKQLLAIARAADPEPLRNRLRWALEKKDIQKLVDIAGSKEVQNLPPATLVVLAKSLGTKGEHSQVTLQLLKDGQQHHTTDFWINERLANCFSHAEPPNFDEAIRFYTAALAIRPDAAIAHCGLGFALMDKGRLDEAIAAHRQAIQLVPDVAMFHSSLGIALEKKGLFDEAIAAHREAVRLNSSFAESHHNLGTALVKSGRDDEAIAAFRKAISLKPDFHWAYSNLGTALGWKGQHDDAIAAYREAIRVKPDFLEAYVNLGTALGQKGQHDDAIAAFREAIRLKPNEPNAHFGLGLYFASKKQYEEAIAAFREAIRLKPNYSKAHYNLAIALNTQGHVNEAIASYQEAIRLKPNFLEAHYNLAFVLDKQGHVNEAIASYQEAIRLNPSFAQLHYNLGSCLNEAGRLDEAIAAFRKAISLKPDHYSAYLNMGTAFQKKGKYDEAISAIREAILLKPDYPEAHDNLGTALGRKGQHDDAIAAFREAIRLKPDYANAHRNLGIVFRNKGQHDNAIAAFREAIRLKPDYPEAHTSLGWALHANKQFEEAIAAFREALRLKPNAKAHYTLGQAFHFQGRPNEAIASYQEALRHSPKYPAARTNLSGLLMQTGRLDEAITVVLEGAHAAGNTAQAHFTAASQLENIGAMAEAIRELQAAVRLEPKNAEYRNQLAWLLVTAKEVKDRNAAEALVHAKMAVELAPKNPANLNTLGVAHFRNGDWKVAIEVLNRAIEVRGEGHCADYFPLAMAHWQLGDKVQARGCCDKGVQRMETVPKERTDVIIQRFCAEAAELLGIAAPNQDGKDSSAPKK